MINALVAFVGASEDGQVWINSTANWISVVHQQTPPPLSIFTRIYFSNKYRPEISSSVPIFQAFSILGNVTESSLETQIYPAFAPLDDYDVVLVKTRYDATFGSSMLEILRAQGIDTVIVVSG
jgi:nicotinamidase-related amidase